MTQALLDTRQLTYLRLNAGLSRGALADRLGVSTPMIRRLEEGTGHAERPLGFFIAYARALGVGPAALLEHLDHEEDQEEEDDRRRRSDHQRPNRTTTVVDDDAHDEHLPAAAAAAATNHDDDDAALAADARRSRRRRVLPEDVLRAEAAFAHRGKMVHRDELARAFGWTPAYAEQVIHRLRESLSGRGVQLTAGAWHQYALQPAAGVLTDGELAAFERAVDARRGVSVQVATVALDLLEERVDATWQRNASTPQRSALAQLVRAGLAEIRDGQVAPTSALRESLPGLE